MADDRKKITALGYALLGLIKMSPASGYELRKIFADTPMGRYSSSPGAIYPALNTLEQARLIRCQTGMGKTGRSKQICHCTAAGTKKLNAWLRQDVTTEDVFHELDIVLLRFSYLDLLNDVSFSIRLLQQFAKAATECRERVRELQQNLAAHQPMHGQFALANGIAVFQTHIDWARETAKSLKRTLQKGGRSS